MRKWVFTLGTDARIRECVNALNYRVRYITERRCVVKTDIKKL